MDLSNGVVPPPSLSDLFISIYSFRRVLATSPTQWFIISGAPLLISDVHWCRTVRFGQDGIRRGRDLRTCRGRPAFLTTF